jgi:hypothetical protein
MSQAARAFSAAVAVSIGIAVANAAAAQQFDMQAEIKAARDALEDAHGNIGGMGGMGIIPEDDLQTIQGMLGEGERLIREARRRAQEADTVQLQAWAVGYARAGRAMVEAANQYRLNQGH